jgi:hypothetical protein
MSYPFYIAVFIILALVIIGAFAAWIKVSKRKKEKSKLIKRFEDFSIKNNLAIDKKQIVRKNIIGIDRLNFKLVFLDNGELRWQFHLIDMENILYCKLIKERINPSTHIRKISLQCMFEKETISGINFVFYDETKDDLFKMMGAYKRASYWKKCIDIFTESAKLSVKRNKKIAV